MAYAKNRKRTPLSCAGLNRPPRTAPVVPAGLKGSSKARRPTLGLPRKRSVGPAPSSFEIMGKRRITSPVFARGEYIAGHSRFEYGAPVFHRRGGGVMDRRHFFLMVQRWRVHFLPAHCPVGGKKTTAPFVLALPKHLKKNPAMVTDSGHFVALNFVFFFFFLFFFFFFFFRIDCGPKRARVCTPNAI